MPRVTKAQLEVANDVLQRQLKEARQENEQLKRRISRTRPLTLSSVASQQLPGQRGHDLQGPESGPHVAAG